MGAREEEALGGLTLEQFAGVTAATAEGVPLVEVLSQEQISPDQWPEGARLWREAVVDDPSLQMELVRLRRVAEECLHRKVDPIEDDAASWVGLLRALGEAPNTAAFLGALGLSSSDVSRVGRRWKDKAKEDKEVEKTLQSLSATADAPKRVNVGPRILRPFPWTPRPAARSSEEDPIRPVEPARGVVVAEVVVQRASFQLATPKLVEPATPLSDGQTEEIDGRGLTPLLARDPLPFTSGPASLPGARVSPFELEDLERGETLMADGSAIREALTVGAIPFANREDRVRASVEGRIERFAVIQAELARASDLEAALATFGFSKESWEIERRALAAELERNPALRAHYERAWHGASKR